MIRVVRIGLVKRAPVALSGTVNVLKKPSSAWG